MPGSRRSTSQRDATYPHRPARSIAGVGTMETYAAPLAGDRGFIRDWALHRHRPPGIGRRCPHARGNPPSSPEHPRRRRISSQCDIQRYRISCCPMAQQRDVPDAQPDTSLFEQRRASRSRARARMSGTIATHAATPAATTTQKTAAISGNVRNASTARMASQQTATATAQILAVAMAAPSGNAHPAPPFPATARPCRCGNFCCRRSHPRRTQRRAHSAALQPLRAGCCSAFHGARFLLRPRCNNAGLNPGIRRVPEN